MLSRTELPIIQAPMAGGPSTVELAAAVSNAGGLGNLAAGYLDAAAMTEQVGRLRTLTGKPFGVNVFVPETARPAPEALVGYAQVLAPVAGELGLAQPEPGHYSDDDYPEKIEALVSDPVPVVSFTFGLPDTADVVRLQDAGSSVILSISSAEDARAAAELGPDALVVQGAEAGGHRATVDMAIEPNEEGVDQLLTDVGELTELPLIAAGGIGTPERAAEVLSAGAVAVQAGTAYLTCHEAGTRPLHKQALLSGEYSETVPTRVFSGRVGRGLRNRFIDRLQHEQIAAYPQVHYMTSSLRAAGAKAGDAGYLNLWAGTSHAHCRDTSAAELTRWLAGRR